MAQLHWSCFIYTLTDSSRIFAHSTQANDLHFQAYLLEGLVRWNEDRATDAIASSSRVEARDRSFSGSLKQAVNERHQKVFGSVLNKNLHSPRPYTGELFGVKYLYRQTGKALLDVMLKPSEIQDKEKQCEDIIVEEIDIGFVDDWDLDPTLPSDTRDIPRPSLSTTQRHSSESADDIFTPMPHQHIATDRKSVV